MLRRLDIIGVHYALSDRLRADITKQLGRLDRYIPKHARESAHMEVRLREAKHEGRVLPECEVSLKLPRETIVLKEFGATIYAAVDIAEDKLKQQIKRYKDQLPSGERSQHIFARLRRRLGSKPR
jgi:ribosomal subunit interface protein